jgi:hypothetical protein
MRFCVRRVAFSIANQQWLLIGKRKNEWKNIIKANETYALTLISAAQSNKNS